MNDRRKADRERLVKVLSVPIYPHLDADPAEVVADYLLDEGVTFAKDTNVPGKWIPANEPPKEPGEYIVMICGAAKPTTLMYDSDLKAWYEEEDQDHVLYGVDYWMPLPEPPDPNDEMPEVLRSIAEMIGEG